jgi:hypothetical protein
VKDNTLTLTYTDANLLDGFAPPEQSRFTVSTRSVTGVTVNPNGRQVLVTFSGTAITGTSTVTFSYTKPSSGNDALAIQDLAGNDAPSIPSQSATGVANDTTPPTLTSITNSVSNSASVLQPVTFTITFSEAIDTSSFTVSDLINVGTAAVNFGNLVRSSSGVFTLVGTPTTEGTIQLQIRQGEVVLDLAGNALNTTNAVAGTSPQTVTVSKVAQTITFAQIDDKTFGDPAFPLSASASSGLPVTYTVSGPARINGSVVTLTGVGTVTITASQAGNAEFAAATQPNTFQVATVNAAGVPRINIRGGNGVSIRPGSTSTLKFDGTDLGASKAPGGLPSVSVFTIENIGGGTLTLGDISITGDHASDFVLGPLNQTAVLSNSPATFTISFQPSALGSRSAQISIVNSDSENARSPYTFTLRGQGIPPGVADVVFAGGRVEENKLFGDNGIFVGTLTAVPDLNVLNTFELQPGVGNSNFFEIRNRNEVYLLAGPNEAQNTGDAGATFTFSCRAKDNSNNASDYDLFTVTVMKKLANEGDFIIADRGPLASEKEINTGAILLVNKAGSVKRTYTTTLADPYEITTDAAGDFVIANYDFNAATSSVNPKGGIWRVNKVTGAETQITGGAPFITPLGVTVVPAATPNLNAGDYLVLDANYYDATTKTWGAVFAVNPTAARQNDPVSGELTANPENKTLLTFGDKLNFPQGMALAPNGDIYISNLRPPRFPNQTSQSSQIIRVRYNPTADPPKWEQQVISEGGQLNYPAGMAVDPDGNTLVVADFLGRTILHINIGETGTLGAQTVFSSGAPLLFPTHVAIEKDGNYLVADGISPTRNRRLIRVDKGTGLGSVIVIDPALGSSQAFDQPRGVTVVK